jgi:hypothetical protein
VDVDVGVVEVGVGAVESGEFAPPHAGVGGGEDEDLVDTARDAGDDLGDLVGGGVRAFGTFVAADLDAPGRVVGDPAVLDRFAQDQ